MYREAVSAIREGYFWKIPPDLLVRAKAMHPLKVCWMDIFQLRIFHWIPSAVLGANWKPRCPTCNRKCIRNGHSHLPRLVFDQHDNYCLNAPETYACTHCAADLS